MAKINYKKLEKIACSKNEYFTEKLQNSFCRWARNNCKRCSNKENLAVCQNWACEKLQKFFESAYYKNLFIGMPEYALMKIKKRGRIYEESSSGITRKIDSARKEHICNFCGKTIRIGSPYLSTIDFTERKVWCSCDDCHRTIIWLYGD